MSRRGCGGDLAAAQALRVLGVENPVPLPGRRPSIYPWLPRMSQYRKRSRQLLPAVRPPAAARSHLPRAGALRPPPGAVMLRRRGALRWQRTRGGGAAVVVPQPSLRRGGPRALPGGSPGGRALRGAPACGGGVAGAPRPFRGLGGLGRWRRKRRFRGGGSSAPRLTPMPVGAPGFSSGQGGSTGPHGAGRRLALRRATRVGGLQKGAEITGPSSPFPPPIRFLPPTPPQLPLFQVIFFKMRLVTAAARPAALPRPREKTHFSD